MATISVGKNATQRHELQNCRGLSSFIRARIVRHRNGLLLSWVIDESVYERPPCWNLQTANDDQSKSQDSQFLKKKEMSKP